MTQSAPPLRLFVAAWLLALSAVEGLAVPVQAADLKHPAPNLAGFKSEFEIERIRSDIGALLASPDADPKGATHDRLQELSGDLSKLFGEKTDPEALGAFLRSDRAFIASLSSIYADARYASRLPPLPDWFQRELALVQVGEAMEQNQKQIAQLDAKGTLTGPQRKALEGARQRIQALNQVAVQLQGAAGAGDMHAALASLSRYFENAAPGSGVSTSGAAATSGAKTPPARSSVPGKRPAVSAPAPPPPKAGAVRPAPLGSSYLPSLRMSLDALQASFPMPADASALAQAASAQRIRHQASRVWSALYGMTEQCRVKEAGGADCAKVTSLYGQKDCASARQLAAADCRQASEILGERKEISQAMNAALAAKQADAYHAGLLRLGAWNERAEAFLRQYLQKWMEAQNRPGAVGRFLEKHKTTGKVVGVVGEGLGYLGDSGLTATYHLWGVEGVAVGKYYQAQAAIGRAYAKLYRFLGADQVAGFTEEVARRMEQDGRNTVTYGVATMMQSRWARRDWMYAASSDATRDDLRTFATAHMQERWGAALPAAAYLGFADREPTDNSVIAAVREGAGGIKGGVRFMMDEAAHEWSAGGSAGKVKAGGLMALVGTIKAGEFVGQMLGFEGIGAAAGALAKTRPMVGLATAVEGTSAYQKAAALTARVGQRPLGAAGLSVARNSGHIVALSPMAVGAADGIEKTAEALLHQSGEARVRTLVEAVPETIVSGAMLGAGLYRIGAQARGAYQSTKARSEFLAADPKFQEAVLGAMGEPAALPAALEASARVGEVKAIGRLGPEDFVVDGRPTHKVGSGGIKEVLAHPEDADYVVKMFKPTRERGGSLSNKRYEANLAAALEEAEFSGPHTAASGAAVYNGKETVGWMVQERVRGSDLSQPTPIKIQKVGELFDNMVRHRLKIVDTVKLRENLMVGETVSHPDLKAYVIDADIVQRVPERALLDRMLGKPDPLRAHYDDLLRQFGQGLRHPDYVKEFASPVHRDAGTGFSGPPPATPPETPTRTLSEKAMALRESLPPEQQAAWAGFKTEVLRSLEAEGYPPERAAEILTRVEGGEGGAPLVKNALLKPEATANALTTAIRFKLVAEAVKSRLIGEGESETRLNYWLRQQRNREALLGLGPEEARLLIKEQFAEIDRAAVVAKELAVAKDYDGLLRFVENVEETRPGVAPYLKTWKNLALKKTYERATHSWVADEKVAGAYSDAQKAGRIETFYRTENLECQAGPSCAIHAVYNIVASHLSEQGAEPPGYGPFEDAFVRRLLPLTKGRGRVGWDTGTSPKEVEIVARDMGLRAEQIASIPQDQAAFDALLRSREGAAYASIRYAEADPVRGKAAQNHAVFIGEKWTDAKGRTWYSVADSNGNPGDLAHYTWEGLRRRLNFMVLLKPEDPAVFQAKIFEFARSERGPPGARTASVTEDESPVEWGRVASDPDYARATMRRFPGTFTSQTEFYDYARSMAGGRGSLDAAALRRAPPPGLPQRSPGPAERQKLLSVSGIAHDVGNKMTPVVGFLTLVEMHHPEYGGRVKPALAASRETIAAIEDARAALRDVPPDLTKAKALLESARRNQEPLMASIREALADAPDGPRRLLEIALHSAQEAGRLLEAAKTGLVTVQAVPVAPSRLLGAAEEQAGTVLARQKRITIEVNADPDLPPVLADPARVDQILTNLLTNPIKLSPEGSKIIIEVTRQLDQAGNPTGYLRFSVKDTAGGIKASDLPLLFNEGVQLEAGRKAGGTGFGLANAKALVEAQGGTVSVQSTEGVGSTFSFTLPEVPKVGRAAGRLGGAIAPERAPPAVAQPSAEAAVLERIRKQNLPTGGTFVFEPPKNYKPGNPLPVEREGNTKGFIDKYGNVWRRGPYHGRPGPDAPAFEWDVQLSKAGQQMWGQYSRGKGYINVKPDGALSH